MDFDEDLTELYFVIENMEQSLKDKIPDFIKNAIKRNVNINSLRYIVGLDIDRISEKTKAYLSYIYTEFLCEDEEEIAKWNELDKIYLEKFNILEL